MFLPSTFGEKSLHPDLAQNFLDVLQAFVHDVIGK